MSESEVKDAPGIESLALDADSYVNGEWVRVHGTKAEILVARTTNARFIEWLSNPENKSIRDTNGEKAVRAFYGEVVVRGIRGVSFEWTPEGGRKLLTQTKHVVDSLTKEEVEVFVYDPIYEAAVAHNESPTSYRAKILPN